MPFLVCFMLFWVQNKCLYNALKARKSMQNLKKALKMHLLTA